MLGTGSVAGSELKLLTGVLPGPSQRVCSVMEERRPGWHRATSLGVGSSRHLGFCPSSALGLLLLSVLGKPIPLSGPQFPRRCNDLLDSSRSPILACVHQSLLEGC